jgi:hypothetical protein
MTDLTRLEIIMSTQRMLGIVVLILGAILVVIGMNASHSIADQVNSSFTGRFTDRTTWLIMGGIAMSLLGLGLVLFGARRRIGGINAL